MNHDCGADIERLQVGAGRSFGDFAGFVEAGAVAGTNELLVGQTVGHFAAAMGANRAASGETGFGVRNNDFLIAYLNDLETADFFQVFVLGKL